MSWERRSSHVVADIELVFFEMGIVKQTIQTKDDMSFVPE
jgi:hypothetical protein